MTATLTAPTTAPASFTKEADGMLDDMVALRRAIHADPELGLSLPRTQKRVLDALKGLPLEITTGKKTTSVIAVLRGDKPGPVVLLRGDMDALPLKEETGLPFASTNGAAHACGHDLHTSSLVGAARLLSNHKADLPGTVIFMFQPGEEGYSGAKVMLDEGLLDAAGQRPVAAYAIHVASVGDRGNMVTKPGTITAGSNNLNFTITGEGGHGSSPQLGIDPVPVAAEIISALQAFVTRRFSVFDPIVLSVTQVDTAPGAINVIPEFVKLGATVRNVSKASYETLTTDLPKLISDIAAAHGAKADVDFEQLYPPTINDEGLTANVVSDLRAEFGEDTVKVIPSPIMGSEDFSFVLEEVPGTFVGLSARPPSIAPDKAEFNHSPKAVFDDAVLPEEAAALATMAWSRLARG
jgi:hippurate hydrolase